MENEGNLYMVVVNNYWGVDQKVTVDLNAPAYSIDSDGQFHQLAVGETELELPRGEMVVIKYR